MKKFDIRLLVFGGSLLFAASCFMNSYMSPDYGKDQFIWANIVRAFGQPFTIVPVTALATATIARRDAGDGSAIFNMFRNLGGSVGIAVLDTVTVRREQFHDSVIGDSVTPFRADVRAQLASTQRSFINQGFDPATAMTQAYSSLQTTVRTAANVMAYNDAFLIVGFGLVIGAVLVWFCKKPDPAAGAAAG